MFGIREGTEHLREILRISAQCHLIADIGTQKHHEEIEKDQSRDHFSGSLFSIGKEQEMDPVEEKRQDRNDIQSREKKTEKVIEKDAESAHLADGKEDEDRHKNADDQPA